VIQPQPPRARHTYRSQEQNLGHQKRGVDVSADEHVRHARQDEQAGPEERVQRESREPEDEEMTTGPSQGSASVGVDLLRRCRVRGCVFLVQLCEDKIVGHG